MVKCKVIYIIIITHKEIQTVMPCAAIFRFWANKFNWIKYWVCALYVWERRVAFVSCGDTNIKRRDYNVRRLLNGRSFIWWPAKGNHRCTSNSKDSIGGRTGDHLDTGAVMWNNGLHFGKRCYKQQRRCEKEAPNHLLVHRLIYRCGKLLRFKPLKPSVLCLDCNNDWK